MPQADPIASLVREAFDDYHARFAAVSRRAKRRFETRDWAGAREDAAERLDLYDRCIGECSARLAAVLGTQAHDRALWTAVRDAYAAAIAEAIDTELYKTFYNTLTRRFFRTRGVDPAIEFVALDIEPTDAITRPVARHAYAVSGTRQADLTTVVDHAAADGVTSQLTKGVVRDTARGVFQGKIVVERGADGTDARMGHHALILSERGEVDAKPELIIYADDVQCAHGNTVGSLDQNALFYMQQRGVPLEEARALLTEAFLIEVVDRIGHESAREVVREWLTARL